MAWSPTVTPAWLEIMADWVTSEVKSTSAEQPVRSYLVSEDPPLRQHNRQLVTCRLSEQQQVSRGPGMLHKSPSRTFWSDPCVRIKQGAHYVVTKCEAHLFTPRRDNGLICLQLKSPQTQNNPDSIIRRAGGVLRQIRGCSSPGTHWKHWGGHCFSTTRAQRWISGERCVLLHCL